MNREELSAAERRFLDLLCNPSTSRVRAWSLAVGGGIGLALVVIAAALVDKTFAVSPDDPVCQTVES